MKNYAILFAGQGSQYLGMGLDFYDKYDYVRDMYSDASRILGYDLAELVRNNDDLINQTLYTQVAVFVTSSIIYEVLAREFKIRPVVALGFSLGEYSALAASGVYSFKDTLELVKSRATFMNEATISNPGKMAAVIGLDRLELETMCSELGNISIANYNSPNQLVVSGSSKSIEEILNRLKSLGKRAVPLSVSGAFHSPFMSEAANKMKKLLETTIPNNPSFHVIANYNALPLKIENVVESLKLQIESSVYLEDSIRYIIANYEVDEFIEIGPGKVISGFMKRIDSSKIVISIDKVDDLIKLNV